MKHEMWELKQMQCLPLHAKVSMTITRVRGWLNAWDDNCYIAFSGGKDSTVLVDIIHNKMGRTDIPIVFSDTGLEYPEVRDFVKTYGDKVTWIRPKMNFRQVVEKYGYPMFSKETSDAVYYAKKYLKKIADNDDVDLIELAESKDKWDMPYRVALMMGTFESHWDKKKNGLMPKDGELSKARFQQKKYQFMLNAKFDISPYCCSVMKKNPMHKYVEATGQKPITAEMASESSLRTRVWLRYGCNGFDMNEPKSMPMAFWSEQDVLNYIKQNDLPIASVYGDVVEEDEIAGQMRFDDLDKKFGEFKLGPPTLKTTGCSRTGCMFCGFGCHLNNDDRFVKMKETHPKQYEWIMKPWDEGGLGYKEVIDWINEHGNMNIRY